LRAYPLLLITQKFGDNHTYKQITGDSTFKTHTDKGMCYMALMYLYTPNTADYAWPAVYTMPARQLCEKLNLKSIIAGGRIPNYQKFQTTLRPAIH
jgi:hypothetical protein